MTRTTKLRRLQQIELRPNQEKSALLIRLTFRSSSRPPSTIAFELVAQDAMDLLSALQTVQRRQGWRVPQFFGPRRRPSLRIVKTDDS